MKHSPQIELTNARLALGIAKTACPHWSCEGFDADERHDCCYDVDDAQRRVKAAKRAVDRPVRA